MRAALESDAWRKHAEANRTDMLAAGAWGVPCFRLVSDAKTGPILWGQDRLWALERGLLAPPT
jgi:2-hydroxychromene-2-carboxylate isomerase